MKAKRSSNENVEVLVNMSYPAPEVYAWPRYIPKNRYLDLLYNAVSDLGYEVRPLRWRPQSIIGAALSRSKNKWLHFHWVGLPPRPFIVTLCYWTIILGGMLVLRLGGCRLVWTLHDIRPHNSRWRKLDYLGYKLVLSMTNVVISHSKWVENQVRELYGWNGKIVVVPHGSYRSVYLSKVNPSEIRKMYCTSVEARVFLFVGTLSPYKGIDHLIDAFKEMKNENIALWIVGSGTSRMVSELKQCIGTDGRITFDARYVPDEELGSLLSAADVVVLPYTNISTSGSVVLAHSFGRPVIAPRMGSIPEYTNDQSSVLYDPCDPDGLLGALSKWMESDTLSMGKYALEASEQWSWKRAAFELIRIVTTNEDDT